MKTLFLSLILSVLSLSSNAQSFYRAIVTELYTKNQYTDKWDLYQKNSDVKIDLCIEEEFITFFANSPTMYKVYKNTKKEISFSSYSGYSYLAKDLKKDVYVSLDLVREPQTGVTMLSVVNNSEGFNLRYFLIVKD